MAASDNLGGQFDFNREINRQEIPKEHHEAILNALQHYGEQGVELMPHGIGFHKDGNHHIVPSGFTKLHVTENSHPSTSAFFGFVPNESQQYVFAADHVGGGRTFDTPSEAKVPFGAVGIKRSGLTHPRWEADSGALVPTYQNRKWDEEPAYVDQGEYRQETDPSKMASHRRLHSFVGEGVVGASGWGRHLMAGNRKPDPRVRVTVFKEGTSRYHGDEGEALAYYHYHPGTGSITRREPDDRDDY